MLPLPYFYLEELGLKGTESFSTNLNLFSLFLTYLGEKEGRKRERGERERDRRRD